MKKKILFLLPGVAYKPCGGFKVVYEYANGLCRKGYDVTVVHPARSRKDIDFKKFFFEWVLYFISLLHFRKWKPIDWFKIHKDVHLILTPSLSKFWIFLWNNYDIVIATSWETAEWIKDYDVHKDKKFYFIQHFEIWSGKEDSVLRTWKLPLKKIVIAKWLEQKATSLGEKCIYIPNGLDFGVFNIDNNIEKRDLNRILMRYDDAYWKGSKYGIEAIAMVKKEFPEIKFSLFGKQKRPHNLPKWIDYYCNPSQEKLRELYNSSAIFIAPSLAEGWALPPAESMVCGCALVSTDIPGVSDYAIDHKTALLSKPKSSEEMRDNVIFLLRNPEKRILLAKRGNEYIQKFTWERSINSFENYIFSQEK